MTRDRTATDTPPGWGGVSSARSGHAVEPVGPVDPVEPAGPLVMVVDDEAPIRQIVRRYLEAEGFRVVEAAGGAEALDRFGAGPADAVILDVMMPGVDGLEVLRRIRSASDAYVIMLTARTEEVDRLVGLAVGADDYITKPFSPRELVARVKAVLRRPRSPAGAPTGTPAGSAADSPAGSAGGSAPGPAWDDVVRLAGLEIDRARHEVRLDGAPVELTALEFEMLAAMASSPGLVFTRRQLLERVWGYDFFGDERVVDVHIRNLRRKLGDDSANPRFIATVRGVGYKMERDRG